MELVRKVGLLGTNDLRKLAPIGDIGYLNSISFFRGDFLRSTLPSSIINAFMEQRERYGFTLERGDGPYRCDHWARCKELGLIWHVDSSD